MTGNGFYCFPWMRRQTQQRPACALTALLKPACCFYPVTCGTVSTSTCLQNVREFSQRSVLTSPSVCVCVCVCVCVRSRVIFHHLVVFIKSHRDRSGWWGQSAAAWTDLWVLMSHTLVCEIHPRLLGKREALSSVINSLYLWSAL